MHVATSIQSAVCVVRCKRLAHEPEQEAGLEPFFLGPGSRSDSYRVGEAGGGACPGVRERRSPAAPEAAAGCFGLFGRIGLRAGLVGRANRLKFHDHRIGVKLYCRRRQQAAGAAADLHRDRDWLETCSGCN